MSQSSPRAHQVYMILLDTNEDVGGAGQCQITAALIFFSGQLVNGNPS